MASRYSKKQGSQDRCQACQSNILTSEANFDTIADSPSQYIFNHPLLHALDIRKTFYSVIAGGSQSPTYRRRWGSSFKESINHRSADVVSRSTSHSELEYTCACCLGITEPHYANHGISTTPTSTKQDGVSGAARFPHSTFPSYTKSNCNICVFITILQSLLTFEIYPLTSPL